MHVLDDAALYAHLYFVLFACCLACAGGWIFGAGRPRRGLVMGALGVGIFLADHWIFN